MNGARAGAIAVMLCAAAGAGAQRLPSAERKPALTRNENWGMHLGVDVISVAFEPTRCQGVTNLPSGVRVFAVAQPCEDELVTYRSHGLGIGLNAGAVFLRHILFGGEVWGVVFSGTRRFADASTASGTGGETTNTIGGSVYVGGVTSPLGNARRLGRKVWLGTLLGKSHWTGKRYCTECQFMPMKMGRPAFVEPFAMFGGGDGDGGGGLRLAYRHNFGGFDAMHGAATLGLFFAFGKL